MMMTQIVSQPKADCGAAIEVPGARGELDLATADGLAEQGHAAIARHPWLLLFDLTGLSPCAARGSVGSSGSPAASV